MSDTVCDGYALPGRHGTAGGLRRIEQIFAAQLPDIPLFSQQDEVEFNGIAVTGYPTASDPYTSSDVYERPDLGGIVARLAPVGPARQG